MLEGNSKADIMISEVVRGGWGVAQRWQRDQIGASVLVAGWLKFGYSREGARERKIGVRLWDRLKLLI